MTRNAITAAALAALALCAAAPVAQARTNATVIIQTAPPPPRHEVLPPQRHGMVWVAGHWEWRHNRYVWMEGYWVKARPGHVYRPPTWQERDGHWHMDRGRWERGRRDRDGDGVPNRDDRDPHNPYRR